MQKMEIYNPVMFCFAHLSDLFKILSQYCKIWVFSHTCMNLRLVLKNWTIWNISINFQMTVLNHGPMAAAPSEQGKAPPVHHSL